MKNILLSFCILMGLAVVAQAKEDQKILVPCAHPMFRALDFWVGDWKVYHRESGALAGYDRVGRILKGCAIQQSWVSLDDHFSSPMVPFRMNGKSLTAFNGQEWVQFWVDNQAGSQIIKGKFQDDKLTMKSPEPILGHIYKLTWRLNKEGTLRHVARRRKVEQEAWEVLFDFIYRRNNSELP